MLAPERRPPIGWIVVAHVIGGLVIGGLDAARVGSVTLALAVVPVFAATGLLAGLVIAGAERLVIARAIAERRWLAPFVLAAPTAIVTVPVAGSLFDGAYAQTLPLAAQAPVLVPI